MKKLFLIAGVILMQFHSNSQSLSIGDFQKSASYRLLLENEFFIGKEINFDLSKVVSDEVNSQQISVLHLYITNGESVNIGRILAIKNRSSLFLPNNHDWVMLYADFTGIDERESGILRLYDLNWDNYQAARFTLNEGSVEKWEAEPVPDKIRENYGRLAPTHYCDGNKNGDISFGECYSCMWNSCQSNPECKALCDFADKFGRPKNQCKISMAAACVWISIFN